MNTDSFCALESFGLCVGIISCFRKINQDIYQENGNKTIGKFKRIIRSGLHIGRTWKLIAIKPLSSTALLYCTFLARSYLYFTYTRVANLFITIYELTLHITIIGFHCDCTCLSCIMINYLWQHSITTV